MQETIRYGDVLLADANAPTRDIISDWRLRLASDFQVREYLRADAAEPLGRGNSRVEISLDVAREHESLAAARAFGRDHFAAIRRATATTIVFILAGETADEMTLFDAAVPGCEFEQRGHTTIARYTITGGYFA